MSHAYSPSENRVIDARRKFWFKIKIFLLDGLLRPSRPMNMVRLGTYYGGWWIPAPPAEPGLAVCAGAGLDVSFDLELMRLGYEVVTVDPTPESLDFIASSAPQLTVLALGLWDSSGKLLFQRDETYTDSWAIKEVSIGETDSSEFSVVTVKDLLGSLGRQAIAILKLDIEGAEHRVLQSIVQDCIRPACICVEFDDQRLRKILKSWRTLHRSGYRLMQIENYNFSFVDAQNSHT